MSTERAVIGIGIGPFNLGLAALLDGQPDLGAHFIERRPRFAWHHGLMVPGARVQVPFLADLVTLADPTSPHSFLNHLHRRGDLYRFYFREDLHPLRREFDHYCRAVAEALPSCHFGVSATAIVRDDRADLWRVDTEDEAGARAALTARHVVLGVGSVPARPAWAPADDGRSLVHSAAYLTVRERLQRVGRVAVIGSGQSAAEVVADLLEGERPPALTWLTRGAGFLPMEYSKLGLEHFSPEYTDHFHRLDQSVRDRLRADQDLLYKGISADTSARIYDRLYELAVSGHPVDEIEYRARCEVRGLERRADGGWRMSAVHRDDGGHIERTVDAVVLATGHEPAPWPDLELPGGVARDEAGRPLITRDYRVQRADGRPSTLFVQNAELHSHGVGTPDLGLAAHRNAVIINAIAGQERYPVRARNVFQRFGGGA